MKRKLKVIDLFAGAGGLGLGFEQAGFEVAAAFEVDEWACETLRYNQPSLRVYQQDLTAIADEQIRAIFDSTHISGIIGGPPCQGFSHSNVTRRDKSDPSDLPPRK